MATRKQRELDVYLRVMLGDKAVSNYYSKGATLSHQGSSLIPKGKPQIPDSSRKGGLGDRR